MHAAIKKPLLAISGLILVTIGSLVLFAPQALHGAAGVALEDNASLLSEIRAPGGLLLASGLFVVAGVFVSTLEFAAFALSTLIYLSYGVARLWSLLVDGMPADAIVQATGLELFLGAASLVAALMTRDATVAAQ